MQTKLFEILVCPVTKGHLEYKRDADNPNGGELISPVAKLAFPIRDGIPVLLEEQARVLNADGK